MKNIPTFDEYLSEAAAINQPVANKEKIEEKDKKTEEGCDDEEEETEATDESVVTEAFKIKVSDEYGKQMWDGHSKDIITLARKMADNYADRDSYEIVCQALSEIFGAIANTEDEKLINTLTK